MRLQQYTYSAVYTWTKWEDLSNIHPEALEYIYNKWTYVTKRIVWTKRCDGVLHAEYKCAYGICTSAKQKLRGHNTVGGDGGDGTDENGILRNPASSAEPGPNNTICYLYHVPFRGGRLSHHAVWTTAAATRFLFYRHWDNRWWFLDLRGGGERSDRGEGVHLLWREDGFFKWGNKAQLLEVEDGRLSLESVSG